VRYRYDCHVARRQFVVDVAALVVWFEACVVQTLGLVNVRELLKDEALVIPGRNRSLFMTQPFADPCVIWFFCFVRTATEGGVGLLAFFHGSIRNNQFGNRASG